MSYLDERNKIRYSMRVLRQSVTNMHKSKYSQLLFQQAINYKPIIEANKIAIFLSVDGEIDTQLLINFFWKINKQIFLPVIEASKSKKLIFVQYIAQTELKLNKFNILEPILNNKIINLDDLDIMLVPIVAFDLKGQRLGRGGGYYDRILQAWQSQKFLPIGLAYDFQLINELPTAPWDIPLPIIITPQKIWQW